MSVQEYVVSAVSQQTEEFTFESHGNPIALKVYWVKLEGNGDTPYQLFRQPKTAPPKQGDKLTGEIVDAKRKGASGEWQDVKRLKVKSERNGVGRTGQSREDPREVRANMAVKTAYEQISQELRQLPTNERNQEDFQKSVASDATFLFKLASELSQS